MKRFTTIIVYDSWKLEMGQICSNIKVNAYDGILMYKDNF